MTATVPIAVIGGSYHEVSIDPSSRRLWGSAVRAARILRALGDPARLVTCIDESSAAELDSLADVYKLEVEVHPRNQAVRYVYETPIQPAIREGNATAAPLRAEANVVLGFGMSETTWSIEASCVVIDPQHAEVLDVLAATTAERIALVLNEHEARRTTGDTDLIDAATAILARGVEVVVIKCGARGGLVVTDSLSVPFGSVPTPMVDPIGSGDAFTAGFTHAWAVEQTDPVNAANFASRVAAAHSLVGASAFSTDVLAGVTTPVALEPDTVARVYLAAPFFDVGQRALVRIARDALLHLGVEVFSPLHEIGRGGDEVATQDLDGLASATAVLALLDGADPGTLFEAGWATRARIPVVGYAENCDDHAWTMLRGTGALVVNDLSTAIYQAAWSALANGSTRP